MDVPPDGHQRQIVGIVWEDGCYRDRVMTMRCGPVDPEPESHDRCGVDGDTHPNGPGTAIPRNQGEGPSCRPYCSTAAGSEPASDHLPEQEEESVDDQ